VARSENLTGWHLSIGWHLGQVATRWLKRRVWFGLWLNWLIDL